MWGTARPSPRYTRAACTAASAPRRPATSGPREATPRRRPTDRSRNGCGASTSTAGDLAGSPMPLVRAVLLCLVLAPLRAHLRVRTLEAGPPDGAPPRREGRGSLRPPRSLHRRCRRRRGRRPEDRGLRPQEDRDQGLRHGLRLRRRGGAFAAGRRHRTRRARRRAGSRDRASPEGGEPRPLPVPPRIVAASWGHAARRLAGPGTRRGGPRARARRPDCAARGARAGNRFREARGRGRARGSPSRRTRGGVRDECRRGAGVRSRRRRGPRCLGSGTRPVVSRPPRLRGPQRVRSRARPPGGDGRTGGGATASTPAARSAARRRRRRS
jgi:hypothetical protein